MATTFDPDALECLAAIVEEGSFERAAQRLSIAINADSIATWALAASALADGSLVDVAPQVRYRVPLYWHCWNLQSDALARVSAALREAAQHQLEPLAA